MQRLLICTQTVDTDNPVLGFMHRWTIELAKHFGEIHVICLKEGTHTLPENVHVHSLGKEHSDDGRFKNRLRYIQRLNSLAWQLRGEYDVVLVHMNKEYILAAGLLWKLLGKRIYLWYNHPAGGLLTRFAAMFCRKVFATSKFSFTARFKRTTLMPVGIDTERFRPLKDTEREPRSILFFGRIAPSKHPEVLLEALAMLAQKNVPFSAHIYGNPLPEHDTYHAELRRFSERLGLAQRVTFYPGVPNEEAPEIYNAHQICVNTSPSGMYDKTIFEAMACGALVVSSNENLRGEIPEMFVFHEGEIAEPAQKLEFLLGFGGSDMQHYTSDLRSYVTTEHSLALLGRRLRDELA